jgi:hypothetical protein
MKKEVLENNAILMRGDADAPKQGLVEGFKAGLNNFNPVNIAKNYVNRMNHPFETATGAPGGGVEDIPFVPQAVQAGQQAASGDVSGAVGNLAGNAAGVALTAGAVKAAPVVAGAVGDVYNAAKQVVSNVASNPTVRAVAPILAKQAAKIAVNNIPLVGPIARTVMDTAETASKVKAATTPKPVPTTVSSNVKISPNISVNGVADSMGTTPTATPNTPGTANYGGGFQATSGTLDAATQTKLAKFAQAEKTVPHETKVELVKAVKAGDSETVNSIIDGATVRSKVGNQAHEGIVRTDTSIVNKVAVLSKYAADHADVLDLPSIETSANLVDRFVKDNGLGRKSRDTIRKAVLSTGDADLLTALDTVQDFANKAYSHSVTKHGMTGNDSGAYNGISAHSMQMVRQTLDSLK